ncbi:hypothetical protein TNCT_117511 [Trichonephila clavata]|uniref:Uncharacterized protein n=1 Tax=Trichonephila clavata TaxID=2740835 RepID=A0A8X6KTU9_TRICU|nr:hypothetical protein TNCT_117511 [Trichonephila clavata]
MDQDLSDKSREKAARNLDLWWVMTALWITFIVSVFSKVQIAPFLRKTKSLSGTICDGVLCSARRLRVKRYWSVGLLLMEHWLFSLALYFCVYLVFL